MSDTLETDETVFESDHGHEIVLADFARNLERQRDEARAEAQRLREALEGFVDAVKIQGSYGVLYEAFEKAKSALKGPTVATTDTPPKFNLDRETCLRLADMEGDAPVEAGILHPDVHTSPTTEQAKIDMQASYDHMMSSKPSRRIMTAHGKEWWVHTPGDPMPCARTLKVCVLTSLEGPTDPSRADHLGWHVRDEDEGYFWGKIIAWRPADAPDKLPREGVSPG